MNICVAGWYNRGNTIEIFKEVAKKYNLWVISHRLSEELLTSGLNMAVIPNVGLEFGCYDFYIRNKWDKMSDVLFMHDDIDLAGTEVFDIISKIDCDQAYIFESDFERDRNAGKHGRAIYMSGRMIDWMLSVNRSCSASVDHRDTHNPDVVIKGSGDYTGFWYDRNNFGHTTGKPPKGVCHYNESIYTYHFDLGRFRDGKFGKRDYNILKRIIVPSFSLQRRGE
jgi:hypothetical protein